MGSDRTRDQINNRIYLFHGTENKAGENWKKPWSAGCISPPGNQAGQNAFMDQLPKGDSVEYNFTITSRSNSVRHGDME